MSEHHMEYCTGCGYTHKGNCAKPPTPAIRAAAEEIVDVLNDWHFNEKWPGYEDASRFIQQAIRGAVDSRVDKVIDAISDHLEKRNYMDRDMWNYILKRVGKADRIRQGK